MTKKSRPALILIDIQKGFENIAYWGAQRNNPQAEENAARLLRFWRAEGLPLYHVRHCSTDGGSLLHENNEGNEFQDRVQPLGNEPVVQKKVNSAFIGTGLQEQLDEAKITQLVIVGLTTDHCVSTTARMAGNLGFATWVVSDATATFNRRGLEGQDFPAALVHETALASLNGEFATVITTALLLEKLEE